MKRLKAGSQFRGQAKAPCLQRTNFDILCAGISNNSKNWVGHAIMPRGEKVKFKGQLVDSICISVPVNNNGPTRPPITRLDD